MSGVLGENAGTWIELILSFIDDPSKFELPPKVFKLPPEIDFTVEAHLEYANSHWRTVDPRTIKPFDNLQQTLPYWMIFTLPRRASLLYLSVWDEYWENNNREFHQDILYNFQELIQNFIRQELLLYKLVRPFRSRTGHTLLQMQAPINLPEETYNVLIEFTSPQRFMSNIAHFVEDRTLQSGVAYILLVERLALFVSKTKTVDQLVRITEKFVEDLGRLKRIDFSKKSPTPDSPVTKKRKGRGADPEDIATIVEFSLIKLQEYDGYVEIQGHSTDEDRNFRIYGNEEEDLLREEIWKVNQGQSVYPLRALVNSIVVDHYSRPRKKYTLKYGVNIELLPTNWN